MPTVDQSTRPIVFLLQGGGAPIPLLFGVPIVGIIRPEQYSLTRLNRGTVVHTIDSAFLDDFGPGPGQLLIAGHTGWGQGDEAPGIVKLGLLRAMFTEYGARRQRLKLANQDPDVVQLWLADSLNVEALSLYPLEFTIEKNRGRPLLYFYRLRFVILADLLTDAVYGSTDTITSTLSNTAKWAGGLFGGQAA